MRHVCVTQVSQNTAPCNGLLTQGGGKEAYTPDRGVDAERGKYGGHSIQDPPRPGHLLQVPWESPLGGGRQLSRGDPQTPEVTAEVGVAV